MLPRFLTPTEGDILIGGINIHEYTLESLRGRMAFVGQNVVLFNGTIAENIAYAQADKFSEEEIINAANQSSEELKSSSIQYAGDVLKYVENNLEKTLESLRQNRESLQQSEQKTDNQ